MLLSFIILLTSCSVRGEKENPENVSREKCVNYIVETYFQSGSSMTFVNMTDNNNVLKMLNTKKYKPLIVRSPLSNVSVHNEYYVIDADDAKHFIKHLKYLSCDGLWNPNVRFLILLKNLYGDDLRNVFDSLLDHHVTNALILNDALDPDLYTYNPFENFACGRSYDEIFELGKCSKSNTKDLFPYKPVTGLKNCTLKIVLPHWPPFTINPALNIFGSLGMEEYLFKEISKIEKFNYFVTYEGQGDLFTKIYDNLTIVGHLEALRNGDADAVFGGLVLLESRAKSFHYIYLHLLYQETLIYLVKRARPVHEWKNVYLVFNHEAWFALVLTFVVYFMIFVLLFRPKDKCWFVMKMLSYMLSNGSGIRGSAFKRSIFIAWVWYAYLISCHYQSSYSSVTTHPIKEHQVNSEEDIIKYNLQSCISNSILNYLFTASNYTNLFQKQEGCDKFFESIRIVSQSDYKFFTVVLRSLYSFHKYDFYNEYGEPTVYRIEKPLFSTIYAIYFYKGFPLLERLQMDALRLKENGIISIYIKRLFWDVYRLYKFKTKKRVLQVSVPWYMIGTGYSISAFVFLAEVIIGRCRRKN